MTVTAYKNSTWEIQNGDSTQIKPTHDTTDNTSSNHIIKHKETRHTNKNNTKAKLRHGR